MDKLCGEIQVTKYVYTDFEEHLNLLKYDWFFIRSYVTEVAEASEVNEAGEVSKA